MVAGWPLARCISPRTRGPWPTLCFLSRRRQVKSDGLTTAPRGFVGDYMPAFSPDGRSLAFVRISGWVAGEIHLLPLSGDYSAAAEPKRLTSDGRLATSPVWTHDARDIAIRVGRIQPP